MRRFLVISFVVFSMAGVALASPKAGGNAIALKSGQAISYGGMTCTAYPGTNPLNANLVCVRNNLKGYGVVISQESVIVAKQVGTKFNVVFKGKNS